MFAAVAKSIFGSANDRYVRGLGKYVDAVNGFEPNISALSDDELKGQTEVFRQRADLAIRVGLLHRAENLQQPRKVRSWRRISSQLL